MLPWMGIANTIFIASIIQVVITIVYLWKWNQPTCCFLSSSEMEKEKCEQEPPGTLGRFFLFQNDEIVIA